MPDDEMIYIERDSCRVGREEQHDNMKYHDDWKHASEVSVLVDPIETRDKGSLLVHKGGRGGMSVQV